MNRQDAYLAREAKKEKRANQATLDFRIPVGLRIDVQRLAKRYNKSEIDLIRMSLDNAANQFVFLKIFTLFKSDEGDAERMQILLDKRTKAALDSAADGFGISNSLLIKTLLILAVAELNEVKQS